MNKDKSEIKPMFIKNTPCGSYHARSPLIALIYPSTKEKLHLFDKERRKREISLCRKSVLKENDISYTIEVKKKEKLKKKKKFNSFFF